ncbi:MAG: hypothetical protein ACFCVC_17805, partial [Acidimicrobiia bacterium]
MAEHVRAGQDRQRPRLLTNIAAPFGELDGLGEQPDRFPVASGIRSVHSAHAEDRRPRLIVDGEIGGTSQPLRRGRPTTRLDFYESEFPTGNRAGAAVACGTGDASRFVQDDGAFAVVPPNAMHQSTAKRNQRLPVQGGIVADSSFRDRPIQTIEPRP